MRDCIEKTDIQNLFSYLKSRLKSIDNRDIEQGLTNCNIIQIGIAFCLYYNDSCLQAMLKINHVSVRRLLALITRSKGKH